MARISRKSYHTVDEEKRKSMLASIGQELKKNKQIGEFYVISKKQTKKTK